MMRRQALRLYAVGALVVLAAVGCNAILGIDSSTYQPKPDAAMSRDAGRDATPRDAAKDAVPDTRDAGIDAFVCAVVPDAMPEGGRPPDPGSVVCNTYLSKADGGTCSTDTQFCCNYATHVDGKTTACETTADASAGCLGGEAPVECDETGDCEAGKICCFARNSSIDAALNGVLVQLCVPPADGGGCNLPAIVGTAIADTPGTQLCKRNLECGNCTACQVYCCFGSVIEACGNPVDGTCIPGPCGVANSNDGIQDGIESDIDCGGGVPDGGFHSADAEGPVPPCGVGYACRTRFDCDSQDCTIDGGPDGSLGTCVYPPCDTSADCAPAKGCEYPECVHTVDGGKGACLIGTLEPGMPCGTGGTCSATGVCTFN